MNLLLAQLIAAAVEAYKIYQQTHGSTDPTPDQMEANKAAWKAQVALSDLLANTPNPN